MPDWWRDPASIGVPDDALPGMEVTVWSAEQLTETHRSFLSRLPVTSILDLDGGGRLLALHGPPRSFDELITATTPTEQLDDILAEVSASVLAGGHTHVPPLRRHRNLTLVNPGGFGFRSTPSTPTSRCQGS